MMGGVRGGISQSPSNNMFRFLYIIEKILSMIYKIHTFITIFSRDFNFKNYIKFILYMGISGNLTT